MISVLLINNYVTIPSLSGGRTVLPMSLRNGLQGLGQTLRPAIKRHLVEQNVKDIDAKMINDAIQKSYQLKPLIVMSHLLLIGISFQQLTKIL